MKESTWVPPANGNIDGNTPGMGLPIPGI